jgi:hypothetical protein
MTRIETNRGGCVGFASIRSIRWQPSAVSLFVLLQVDFFDGEQEVFGRRAAISAFLAFFVVIETTARNRRDHKERKGGDSSPNGLRQRRLVYFVDRSRWAG